MIKINVRNEKLNLVWVTQNNKIYNFSDLVDVVSR